MSKLLTNVAWLLWQASCRGDAKAYTEALRHPERTQRDQLRSILREASGSAWGLKHGIGSDTSLEEFREQAPVMTAENLNQWTKRIMEGEDRVLTSSPIERLVPTSGTTGPAKLIPMTRQSRREYSAAVNVWIHDLLKSRPEIRNGTAYIATSPAQDFDAADSRVEVGFAEDRDYLGPIARHLLNRILAVPLDVARLRGKEWREATREYLMKARNLRLISVWHPSYLGALFDPDELAQLQSDWPDLQIVSCWSDGSCRHPAEELRIQFPNAKHQAKGLWLTEGVVSIPWQGQHPLALNSGFLEFESQDGEILMSHQLQQGGIYRPLLTNHAGLYRYRIGDLVEVDGFLHSTPSVRWIGRADQVVDLCGEKLSEAQVVDALRKVNWSLPMVMAPSPTTGADHYECHVASDSPAFPLDEFEQALMRNPHYRWAREIGQLSRLVVKHVTPDILDTLGSSGSSHKKSSHLRTQPGQ